MSVAASVSEAHPGGVVMVTGGCGFVGANLVRHLVSVGRDVRVVDNGSGGRPDSLDGCPVEVLMGDVCNAAFLQAALRGVSQVVHLAAVTSVLESVKDPQPTLAMNVVGLVTVLRASVEAGVEKFVFASSNAAVGNAESPVNESQVPRPASPYGASKLAGEAYCWAFAQSYGLPTAILRFANVYGPYSLHKGSAVHKFIRLVLKGEPITIYGDGSQTRDFVHVDDICQAIEAVLRTPMAVELFQVGTGCETAVRDLARLLERVAARPIEVRHAPENPGEVRRSACDTRKARLQLGFTPRVSLEDGLRRTWSWYEAQLETASGSAVVSREAD